MLSEECLFSLNASGTKPHAPRKNATIVVSAARQAGSTEASADKCTHRTWRIGTAGCRCCTAAVRAPDASLPLRAGNSNRADEGSGKWAGDDREARTVGCNEDEEPDQRSVAQRIAAGERAIPREPRLLELQQRTPATADPFRPYAKYARQQTSAPVARAPRPACAPSQPAAGPA